MSGRIVLERMRVTHRSVQCIVVHKETLLIEFFRRHDDIYWRVQVVNEGAPTNAVYSELKDERWRRLDAALDDVETLIQSG